VVPRGIDGFTGMGGRILFMLRQPGQLLEEAQRLTDQANVLWNDAAYADTEALCRRALKLTRAAVGDSDCRVAERLYNLATLYHFQRRFEEARPLYAEAIHIHEAQTLTDHRALAFCFAWLGKTMFEAWRDDPGIDGDAQGQSFEEAEICYRRALALLERSGAAETPEYSGCLIQLGFLHYYCDNLDKAEPLFCRALSLRERLYGSDHLETAEAIGRLAILYWQHEDAQADPEPLFRRALDIRERHLVSGDPEVWEWIFRLAEFCRASGHADEAEELFSRLASLLLDASGAPDEDVDWIVSGCLDYLNETGRSELAAAIDSRWNCETADIRIKRRELKRKERMLGREHPSVVDSLCALAAGLRFEEKYEEAESLYRRALAIREKTGDPKSPELLPILNGIAMLLRAQDRIESARGVLERARGIPYTPDIPYERAEHAHTLEQLAWVCSAENRINEAEDLFHRAIALLDDTDFCDYRETAEMRYRMSIFYASCARYTEAEESLISAFLAAEHTTEIDDLELADYREQYSRILTALGRNKEAAAQIAEVKRIWEDSGAPRDDL
jgi:tetratricopeptide (TPR) repeat protein